MKKVLLATKPDMAEIILTNMNRLEPFNDRSEWAFNCCNDAKQLLTETAPDVLVLARDLPGVDSFKLLEKVNLRFSQSHIVLLIGDINERSRAYMRKAESLGMNNFVKGNLPGQRPYIFTVALTTSYDALMAMKKVQEDLSQENDGENKEIASKITEVIKKRTEGKPIITAVAYGGIWQSRVFDLVNCKNIMQIKKNIKNAGIALISSRAKEAEKAIKIIRATGFINPVILVGPYNLDLISAGATGCVDNVDEASKYL